ncbi:hypothetical protein RDABS01_006520 [Bienertia sinuspersici]
MYAKLNMWDETEQLSNMMQERGIKKDAGCSWVEIFGETSQRELAKYRLSGKSVNKTEEGH